MHIIENASHPAAKTPKKHKKNHEKSPQNTNNTNAITTYHTPVITPVFTTTNTFVLTNINTYRGLCMPNVMQQLFVMNMESLLKEYAAYRAFNKSDRVINMRIPHQILEKIKELADQQHVPYQLLISSVLFSLANIDENK